VGVTKAVGTADTSARADHVHDTATGFIDSSDKFAAGVVNTTALATSAVTTGKLAAGAVTNAKIATGTITSGKLAFGTLEKIVETEVTGAAVTSITITGLDLDAAKAYLIFCKLTNPTATDASLYLYYNGETTATNYWRQYLYATGSTVSGARGNNAYLTPHFAGTETNYVIWIFRDTEGRPRAFLHANYNDPATLTILMNTHVWVSTVNVTQIDFTASVTGAIGIGSKVTIFKVSK